nr:5'-nucleotidase C-terminal domain-containing protein [Halorubellus salinus]
MTLKTEKDVDVVVAAAHIGVPESKELARASDAIDVIVTGDDEVAYAPRTTSGTTIVEAEARGAYVGEVNLTVSDDGVSLASGRLVAVDENSPVNETAKAIVEDARGEQLERVAGRTTVALDSTFASNYHDETAWGNLVTDAFRAETGAAVAVTNAGGIRGNFVMEPGTVTYGDVYTSLPFGNYLVTKEMTGEQLRELLASQVVPRTSNYGAEAKLQVSGVAYEFVPDENATQPVQDVRVNGEALREDATYNVTINSYMAGWSFEERYGWSFGDLPTTGVDQSLYGSVVAEYVNETTPVSPADTNRIRRVDLHVGDATVPVPPGRSDELTVRVDVPAGVSSVNGSTVDVQNATTGSVSATSATVRDGVLVATFDRDAFGTLVASSDDLDLYAHYDGSLYGADNYFRAAILNVDLDVPPGHQAGGPGNASEGERGPPSHAGPPEHAGPPAHAGPSAKKDDDEDDDDENDALVAGAGRAVALH